MRVNHDTEKYIGKFGVFLKSKNTEEQANVLLYDHSIMPLFHSIYATYALAKRDMEGSKAIYFLKETRLDSVEPGRLYYAQRNDYHLGLVKGEYLDDFLRTKDPSTYSIVIMDIEVLPASFTTESVFFMVPTMDLVTGEIFSDHHYLSKKFLMSNGRKNESYLPYTEAWIYEYEESMRRGIPVTGYWAGGKNNESGLGLTTRVGDLL